MERSDHSIKGEALFENYIETIFSRYEVPIELQPAYRVFIRNISDRTASLEVPIPLVEQAIVHAGAVYEQLQSYRNIHKDTLVATHFVSTLLHLCPTLQSRFDLFSLSVESQTGESFRGVHYLDSLVEESSITQEILHEARWLFIGEIHTMLLMYRNGMSRVVESAVENASKRSHLKVRLTKVRSGINDIITEYKGIKQLHMFELLADPWGIVREVEGDLNHLLGQVQNLVNKSSIYHKEPLLERISAAFGDIEDVQKDTLFGQQVSLGHFRRKLEVVLWTANNILDELKPYYETQEDKKLYRKCSNELVNIETKLQSLYDFKQVIHELQMLLTEADSILATVNKEGSNLEENMNFSDCAESLMKAQNVYKQIIEFEEFLSQADSLDELSLLFQIYSLLEKNGIYSIFCRGVVTRYISALPFARREITQEILTLLSMRDELEVSPSTSDDVVVHHHPQYDLTNLLLAAARLGLSPDVQADVAERGLRRLLCLSEDIKIRMEGIIQRDISDFLTLPATQEGYYTFEARLVWNTIGPIISQIQMNRNFSSETLTDLRLIGEELQGIAAEMFSRCSLTKGLFRPLIARLAEQRGRSVSFIQAIFDKGLEYVAKELYWQPFLGREIQRDLKSTLREISVDVQVNIGEKLNRLIFDRFLQFFSVDQQTLVLKPTSPAVSHMGLIPREFTTSRRHLLASDFETVQNDMVFLSRVTKGVLPAIWKEIGGRLHNPFPRELFTASDARTLLLIHGRKSLKTRIAACREYLSDRSICDMLALTSILPAPIAFQVGFYRSTPRIDDGEIAPWVYDIANQIEDLNIGQVITIDTDNAGRQDLPFIQFILLVDEKIIEWRLFLIPFKDKWLIPGTHSLFKHVMEHATGQMATVAFNQLKIFTDTFLLDLDLHPIEVTVTRPAAGDRKIIIDSLLEKSPTKLDVALALGVLHQYLALNPALKDLTTRASEERGGVLKIGNPLVESTSIISGHDLSAGALIQAVDHCISDAREIISYMEQVMHMSVYDIFLSLLRTAGVTDSIGNQIPDRRVSSYAVTLPKRQYEDLMLLLNLFFHGILKLKRVKAIGSSEAMQEIVGYIVRTFQ